MLIGIWDASLLGTLLTSKGTITAGEETIRADAGAIRADQDFWNTNYYQNEPKFNSVYSRNNLPKIKDGAYVVNCDEYKSIGTHWIVCECWTCIILLWFWSWAYPKRNLKFNRKQKYNNKYL